MMAADRLHEEPNQPAENLVEASAARQRAKAAERMRRHRARRKRHCRIIAIEIADFDIAGLVRLGHLDERDREDVMAVGDGVVPVVQPDDCPMLKRDTRAAARCRPGTRQR